MISIVLIQGEYAIRISTNHKGEVVVANSVRGSSKLFPYVAWKRQVDVRLLEILRGEVFSAGERLFEDDEFDITLIVGHPEGLNFTFHVCSVGHPVPVFLVNIGILKYMGEKWHKEVDWEETKEIFLHLLLGLEKMDYEVDSLVDELTQSFHEDEFLSLIPAF